MRNLSRKQLSWASSGSLIAWSLMIIALSSVSGNQYPQVSWPYADKLVHVGLYTVLGFLAAWAFLTRGYRRVVPLLYGLAFGITDEIHQLWVPMRSCSFADWLADAAGTIIGISMYLVVVYKLNSTNPKHARTDTDITDSLELT